MFLLWIVISILLPAPQDALDVPHTVVGSVVRPVDGLEQSILAVVVQTVGESLQICRARYGSDTLFVDLDHLPEVLLLGWRCSRRDMFTVYTVYVGYKICTLGALYGFIFCTHGIVSIELWEMIPHLFLVTWVDGLDEALPFQ